MRESLLKLRYFFDFGGECLWAADDEARSAFGYPVDLDALPLAPQTREFARAAGAAFGSLMATPEDTEDYKRCDEEFAEVSTALFLRLVNSGHRMNCRTKSDIPHNRSINTDARLRPLAALAPCSCAGYLQRKTAMNLPRSVLFTVWIVLTVAAYYLVLFTDFGNYYHGGTPVGAALVDAVVVLGAFSCWEVFRTERPTPLRALAASVGVPLFLVVLLLLWYGLKRHVAV